MSLHTFFLLTHSLPQSSTNAGNCLEATNSENSPSALSSLTVKLLTGSLNSSFRPKFYVYNITAVFHSNPSFIIARVDDVILWRRKDVKKFTEITMSIIWIVDSWIWIFKCVTFHKSNHKRIPLPINQILKLIRHFNNKNSIPKSGN